MNRLRRHWPILGLVFILLFVTLVRWRIRAVPLERDEGEYAYAGQLMLQGIPPYQWVYNFKMPGVYAAYALIMAVFGQTPSGIHLGFCLVNLGAIILMYRLGRRFLGSPASLAAAATFALLSLSQAVVGLAGHATQLVVVAAGRIVLLPRVEERGRLGMILLSGALCRNGFSDEATWRRVCPPGTFRAGSVARGKKKPIFRKKHGPRMAVFCCGVLMPLVVTAGWLWQARVWSRFWFWTVTYASVHATVETWSFGQGPIGLVLRGVEMGRSALALGRSRFGPHLSHGTRRRFFPIALLILIGGRSLSRVLF